MHRDKSGVVLEATNIFHSYPNTPGYQLEGISLSVREGEFVGVVGPNGGGKSTFIKIILGIIKPTIGSVQLFGKKPQKTRKYVGYFPQVKSLDLDFPITVKEVVMSARIENRLIKFPSAEDKRLVRRVLAEVGLEGLEKRKLNELSGGQANRVFLARALACEPKMLVLDEPMAGVDVELQTKFMEILDALNERMTIILVEHNVSLLEKHVHTYACINKCISRGLRFHEVKKILENGWHEHVCDV